MGERQSCATPRGQSARPYLPGSRRVIALDTNILLYAHREDSPFQGAAFRRELAEGRQSGLFHGHACRNSLRSSRIHASMHHRHRWRALDQVDAWLESQTLTLLTGSAVHWATLRGLLADGHIAGAQVHDARVAALCRQHGARQLWSADRDFSRFAGLTVVNPLVHAS